MTKIKNVMEQDVKKVVSENTGLPQRVMSFRENGLIVSLVTGCKIAKYDYFKEVITMY